MTERTSLQNFLCVVLLFCSAYFSARAEDITAAFNDANRLYEQEKFTEAAAEYEKVIEATQKLGRTSEKLYFNLGNAYYKSGQMGRAIAAYLQAQKMAPRNREIQMNLQMARKAVHGETPVAHSQSLLTWWSLNDWIVASTVALWLFIISLILRQWRPDWKKRFSVPTFFGGLFILSLVLVFLAAKQHSIQKSVVIVPEAAVRRGPLEESQTVFTARDGSELRILSRKDDWLQIQDSADRIGWLPEAHVKIVH